jgi:nitroreductase
MDALELLLTRNSSPKLIEPAPNAEELETLFQVAMRAPDHARLRPWRFLVVAGAARERFGQLMADTIGAQGELADKVRAKPLRAPMIIVVLAKLTEHPKVPEIEQLLSAGCAAHNLLLAAEALGYAGIWRTGGISLQPEFWRALEMAEDERIVGFVYLGSREGTPKPLPQLDSRDFIRYL